MLPLLLNNTHLRFALFIEIFLNDFIRILRLGWAVFARAIVNRGCREVVIEYDHLVESILFAAYDRFNWIVGEHFILSVFTFVLSLQDYYYNISCCFHNHSPAAGPCFLPFPSTLQPCPFLLFLVQGQQGDVGYIHHLEPESGNVTDGVTHTTETGDHDLVVLLDVVKANVPGHECGDLLAVLVELDMDTLVDGLFQLLGLDSDLFQYDALGKRIRLPA